MKSYGGNIKFLEEERQIHLPFLDMPCSHSFVLFYFTAASQSEEQWDNACG